MTPPGRLSTVTLHANCVILGEAGVLILGPSGSGKSSLARALVHAAGAAGDHAAHVADDRVLVSREHGRLVARPVRAIAGRMEVRGLGIVTVSRPAAAAVLRLVVGIVPEPLPRHPEAAALRTEILAVALPYRAVTLASGVDVAMWRERGRGDTLVTDL